MYISTAIVFVSFDVFTILSQLPSALSCSPHQESKSMKTEVPPTGKMQTPKPTLTTYLPDIPYRVLKSKCPPCDCVSEYRNGPNYTKLSINEMSNYPFVRGEEAEEKEFPWIAALHADDQVYCAATIISPRHLITAAQCVDGYNIKNHKIKAKVGAFDRLLDINAQKFTVEKITMHPGYTRRRRTFNIAILMLNKPIVFNTPYIKQACLPGVGADRSDYTGFIGVVARWGLSGDRPKAPNALRSFQLPIISNDHCKKVTSLNPRRIVDHTICAGLPEKNVDTCMGDEGGPIHLVGSPSVFIGVNTPNRNCSEIPPPGIYTRVSSFMNWIEKTVGNECLCRV